MHIVRDTTHCPDALRSSVLALGNFDGMHRGHQAIVEHVIDMARHEGRTPAVMTFEPHPREFFSKGQPVCIYRFRQKVKLLEKAGIKHMFVLRFNARLATTTARAFVEDILHKQLAVGHVVTGYDFAFGKGREGTTEFLAGQGHRLGFGFTALPAVMEEGTAISTSAIRQALASGDIARATHMLGHPYTITGKVARGDQRGRQLGFATANIPLHGLFIPRFGVYAAQVKVSGKRHPAVINIGSRPTFSGTQPLLEAHLFDFSREIYGDRVEVQLAHFIRPETKFPDAAALVKQIKADAEKAKALLEETT